MGAPSDRSSPPGDDGPFFIPTLTEDTVASTMTKVTDDPLEHNEGPKKYWCRSRIKKLVVLAVLFALWLWDQVTMFEYAVILYDSAKIVNGPTYIAPLGIDDHKAAWTLDCESLYADNIATTAWFDCRDRGGTICIDGLIPVLQDWLEFVDKYSADFCPLGNDWASMGRYVGWPITNEQLNARLPDSAGRSGPLFRALQSCPPSDRGAPPPGRPPINPECCKGDPLPNYCAGPLDPLEPGSGGGGGGSPGGGGGPPPPTSGGTNGTDGSGAPISGGGGGDVSGRMIPDPTRPYDSQDYPLFIANYSNARPCTPGSEVWRDASATRSCQKDGFVFVSPYLQGHVNFLASGTNAQGGTPAPATCNLDRINEMRTFMVSHYNALLAAANPADPNRGQLAQACDPDTMGVAQTKSFCYLAGLEQPLSRVPPEYGVNGPPEPDWEYAVDPRAEYDSEPRFRIRALSIVNIAMFSIGMVSALGLLGWRCYRIVTMEDTDKHDRKDMWISMALGFVVITYAHVYLALSSPLFIAALNRLTARCRMNVTSTSVIRTLAGFHLQELISASLGVLVRTRLQPSRMLFYLPLVFFVLGGNILTYRAYLRSQRDISPYSADRATHNAYLISAGVLGLLVPVVIFIVWGIWFWRNRRRGKVSVSAAVQGIAP